MGPARVGAPGVRAPPGAVAAPWRAWRCSVPTCCSARSSAGRCRRPATRWWRRTTRPTLQVVDLTADPDERLARRARGELPTLAFYSHVEVDVRRQARGGGRGPRGAALAHGARGRRARRGGSTSLGRWRTPGRGRAGARGSRSARRSGPMPRSAVAVAGGAAAGTRARAHRTGAATTGLLLTRCLRHLAHGGRRVRRAPPRSVPERGQRAPHQVAALVERAARGDQHQLRVARSAVAIDPELARVHAAPAQCHALGVPERHDRVHPSRDQARAPRRSRSSRGARRRATRRRAQHRAQHGVVRGQPGHTDPPPLEVARAADAGAGDHRGERALHERAHAHEVAAALAGQGEVVDVHHREVGAAGARAA